MGVDEINRFNRLVGLNPKWPTMHRLRVFFSGSLQLCCDVARAEQDQPRVDRRSQI